MNKESHSDEWNVELDFTAIPQNDFEPVAVMPTALAKKLLAMYADKLVNASAEQIIRPIISSLEDLLMGKNTDSNAESVYKATEECKLFIQERQLIDNCAKRKWDAYTTPAFYVEPRSINEL